MSGQVCPVLYVSSVAGIGGAELGLIDLIARLDRAAFPPTLYYLAEGPLVDTLRAMGVPAVRGELPFFGWRRSPEYALALARLVIVIRRRRIRVVQVHCDRAVPLAVTAARLAGVPAVACVHDFLRAWYRPPYLGYMNRTRAIVANSEAIGRYCVAQEMRGDLVQVIHCPCDTRSYREAVRRLDPAVRAGLGLTPEDWVIGIVGKVTPNKGHEVLLRALPRVCAALPNVRVLVVGDTSMTGDDAYPERLLAMADDVGVRDRVVMAGLRHDMPAVMAAIDVLAVPSFSEAFGRVAVEALATGRPAVVSAVGGLPEIVADGETGLHVPPGDPEALAAALVRLGTLPDLYRALAARGPRSVARYDVAHFVAQHAQLYHRVAGVAG